MGAFNNLAEATLSRVHSLWSEEGKGWAEEVHPHLYELRDSPALTSTPMPGRSSTITHLPGLTSPWGEVFLGHHKPQSQLDLGSKLL